MPSPNTFIINRGSLLVELLCAFALFLLLYRAVVGLYFATDVIVANLKSDLQNQADEIAAYEELRQKERLGFDNLAMTTLVDDLTRDVVLLGEKHIRLFDWSNALGTKTCEFHADWSHPLARGMIALPASTTATSLVEQGGLVYLSADSSIQSKSDLFIIDVSDSADPRIMSSLNTGPGATSLAVAAGLVYLGNSSINAQLQIVDVKNPASPSLLASYKLPGMYSDGTTVANTIYYSKKKIYLGTKKSSIAELHIIDVSHPLVPFEIGSVEMGTAANGLLVKGHRLYIASPDDREVRIFDTSDMAHITEIANFDALGSSGSGKRFSTVGTTTYLARTFGNEEFYILDTSSSTPQKLGSYKIGATINGLVSGDELVFLATSDPEKELQILSVKDPSHISLIASIDLPEKAVGIDCKDDVIFVALEGTDALRIIAPQ